LLFNSCDGNDLQRNVFFSVDCWWLWKSWFWFSRCSKWCHFAFTHACNRFLHWSAASSMALCDMFPRVSNCVNECCFKSRRVISVAAI